MAILPLGPVAVTLAASIAYQFPFGFWARVHFGLPAIDSMEKVSMRQLAMRGGPYTDDERRELLALL